MQLKKIKMFKNKQKKLPWHKVNTTTTTINHLGLFKNCKHFGRYFPHPKAIQSCSLLYWLLGNSTAIFS